MAFCKKYIYIYISKGDLPRPRFDFCVFAVYDGLWNVALGVKDGVATRDAAARQSSDDAAAGALR